MTTIYRQGDVLIKAIESIPEKTTAVPRENGTIVLAHGEVTGHSHAIASRFAHLAADGARRFLRADREVTLRHEEHGPVQLPAGSYEIVIQREYEPGAVRNVAD
jgi:hypothetical protein